MFDFMFALVAVASNAAGGDDAPQGAAPAEPQVTQEQPAQQPVQQETAQVVPQVQSPTVNIGENVNIGATAIIGGAVQGATPAPSLPVLPTAPAAPQIDESVIPAGLVPDPQTPTGKFTTAAEVKPIMEATKGNWIAVREYDGSDWLYVSHIWAWRCGLKAMAISVNNEPLQNWPLPACHEKFTTPNAILEDDGIPALKMKLGSVQTVTIQVVYDDLSRDVQVFERGNVLIP